jgi:hypothetical protein
MLPGLIPDVADVLIDVAVRQGLKSKLWTAETLVRFWLSLAESGW